MFIELMAYKSILEKWKENLMPLKGKSGLGCIGLPMTRQTIILSLELKRDDEVYVQKYAPTIFRKIFQGSDEGYKT